MVNKTDIHEMGISIAQAVRDAISDPYLLEEKIKALDAIKSARQSLGDLGKEQDNFRREANAARKELSDIQISIDVRDSELKSRHEVLNGREAEITKRERAVSVRDTLSKQREDAIAVKEAEHDKKSVALERMKENMIENNKLLGEREEAVTLRENKLKEALR